ncbi:MAG: hypothetical protein Q9162_002198 [Coniocarpon cinnabarinum]
MPGHVRNKNLHYDDDDFYDDYDDYDDGFDDDYGDEPVAQPIRAPPPKTKPTNSRKDPFDGIHWGRIPSHRASKIVEVPYRTRGRLLGGSEKPSKLQALAAQRRKLQEERNHGNPQASVAALLGVRNDDKTSNLLGQLPTRTQVRGTQHAGGDARMTSNDGSNARSKRQKVEEPESKTRSTSDTGMFDRNGTSTSSVSPCAREMRAEPSAFASALITPSTDHPFRQEPRHYQLKVTRGTNQNPFAGPSPDDVVSKAQSKSTAPQRKKSPPRKSNPNGAVQGVAAMKISDAPNVKSKNLDVPAEYERSDGRGSANFVVIGHVDHGKSTLMGRLLLDLKHPNMSERDYRKLQKSSTEAGKGSFALAWAMDARPDEREHGVTIDIATQHFSTNKIDFTILDAPGHRDFIKNMISGTSQADFAVLVVDASADAFEAGLKGQTREHAMLARSLGISRLVVAVNKMDSAKWNKERYEEIQSQLQGFFTAAGFNQKAVSFIPCAGLTGDNVATPPRGEQQGLASWYLGPTLVQALEASEPRNRRIRDPLRMTVSDVAASGTSGVPTGDVSVTGLIDAGNLQVGTKVLIQPSGEGATIKSITTNNESRDWAVAGQISTLHIVGIEAEHVKPGNVLSEKGRNELQNVRKFTAKCLVFEHLLPTRLALHRGQIYCSAQIQFLEVLDKPGSNVGNDDEAAKKKKRRAPRVAHPQQVVRLLVELYDVEKGLPLDTNDRVVFREEGKTMASGIIDAIEEYVKS